MSLEGDSLTTSASEVLSGDSSATATEMTNEIAENEGKLPEDSSTDQPKGQLPCSVAENSSISLTLPAVSVSGLSEPMIENAPDHTVEQITEISNNPGDSVTSQDISMVLCGKDTKVVYINPDGTLMFNQAELEPNVSENLPIILDLDPNTSSVTSVSGADTASVNPNYLVVVENMDRYQMLSSTAHGNLVLSSSNDITVSGEIPQSQISFSTTGSNKERPTLDMSAADYTPQTITMVLDGGSQLGSKEILVEPNSLITYSDQTTLTTDQLTFHTMNSVSDKAGTTAPLTAQSLYEASEGSFIDISALNVVASETPSSITVHHKPSNQTSTVESQGIQTVWVKREHVSGKGVQRSLLYGTEGTIFSSSGATTDGQIASEDITYNGSSGQRDQTQTVQSEPEEAQLEKKKQEQRFLEQCHLEHHMKQVKLKQNETPAQSYEKRRNQGRGMTEQQEDECALMEEIENFEKAGINDETPIFSSITAKLNSALLTHVPGCQQFLLDKMQQNSAVVCDINFDSDQSCTFSGGLRALMHLHNLLKSLIKSRTRTLLDFKVERNRKSTVDESIMCDLLKPYVSMRGRQPKCSLKVAEMGFVTDIDTYLKVDSVPASPDNEYVTSPSRWESTHTGDKRKRGRPSRVLKRRGRKIKVNYSPIELCDSGSESGKTEQVQEEPAGSCDKLEEDEVLRNEESHGNNECHADSGAEQDDAGTSEADLADPLQQRLLEEQIKYRKIMDRKQKQLVRDFSEDDGETLLPVAPSTRDHSGCEDKNQEPEEADNTASASNTDNVLRQKRGRPRKIYDPYRSVEKVQPRNPLTESAATRQQRNYEEQVSFKFFCTQCSFKTKRQSHFISHMRCHKDGTEKKYTCSQCDFVTISIPTLKRHELRHKENLFSCDLCAAYTTDRIALLRRHIRLKHNVVCVEQKDVTGEKLVRPKTESRDISQETGDDAYNCPECKKSFRSRMHLQRHVRDVHGPEVRPHLCDTCGKAFKRTDALQQHKLVHISRTARSFPFKCTSCGKGFRSPAHLKEHMSMHSTERPFLCQYCGAAFKTQPVQKKHIMTLHIRPRAHVCSVCCRQFNTKHALQRHEHTHVKSDSATEAAVLIIEAQNSISEKEGALEEKHSTLSHVDNQSVGLSAGESATITVEGQINNCLGQDMVGTAAAAASIEEPLEQSGPGLQQAYIQGAQDGTLYYFTGELPTL